VANGDDGIAPFNPAQWVADATRQVDVTGGIDPLVAVLADPANWPGRSDRDQRLQERLRHLAALLRPLTPLYALTAALITPHILSDGAPRAGDDEDEGESAATTTVRANLVAVLALLYDTPVSDAHDPWTELAEWLWSHQSAWAGAAIQEQLGHETVRQMSPGDHRRAITRYLADTDRAELRARSAQSLIAFAQELARAVVDMLDLPGASRARRELLLALRPVDDPAALLPASLPAGGRRVMLPRPSDEHYEVFSSGHYQALREALYDNRFGDADGSPWPTARLTRGGISAQAQLRPPGVDGLTTVAPDQLETWKAEMWKQREQLSDSDADALDALSAIWLYQARSEYDRAVAHVDGLLEMRGIKQRKRGEHHRVGYTHDQRQDMMQALVHIQNLYITITLDGDAKAVARADGMTRVIQSRAFVITDRVGAIDATGTMVDIEAFVFRPGEVFARFLTGPGSQTALLSAMALRYDPYRQKWEKRLARYLSWQWRVKARANQLARPYRIATLLDAASQELNRQKPVLTRERLEKALDTLEDDGVISGWRYDRWDESRAQGRGWWPTWLEATVLIAPPATVEDHYLPHRRQDALALPSRAASASFTMLPATGVAGASAASATAPTTPTTPSSSLHDRIKATRQALKLSQEALAGLLGISQGHLSKIERGLIDPGTFSIDLRDAIDAWLATT